MYAGEVREVKDNHIVQDLLRAGYVEVEVPEAEVVEKPVKKVEKIPEKPAEKSKPKRSRKKSK